MVRSIHPGHPSWTFIHITLSTLLTCCHLHSRVIKCSVLAYYAVPIRFISVLTTAIPCLHVYFLSSASIALFGLLRDIKQSWSRLQAQINDQELAMSQPADTATRATISKSLQYCSTAGSA
ncbi:hypothetical protein ABW21_db0200461 [Orbilia brochopaga]|nr:hypothetical protein ABW21_db0200461 [Drechslerella brochopaga]